MQMTTQPLAWKFGAAFIVAAVGAGFFGQSFYRESELDRDVDIIERLTSKDACVANLAKWSRTYRFPAGSWFLTDQERILFSYKDPSIPEPDGKVLQPGMHKSWDLTVFFRKGWFDDRQQRYASGMYDRRTRTITNWSCGCNVGTENWPSLPDCKS